MPQKFLYSITTGRSGTVYLTELLKANTPDALVLHERFGFRHFGVDCPDASHSTGFNNIGNAPHIRDFWQRKLSRDAACPKKHFIEVSHVLAKAGLVENLDLLPEDSEIHLVALKRDLFKIYWSYINRFDFFNSGFTWLFTLDMRYANVIINSQPFREYGMYGSALWYIYEVFARMEYYRLLTADTSNIHFHQINLEEIIKPEGAKQLISDFIGTEPENIVIPGKQNATKSEFFGDKEKDFARGLMKKLYCDPAQLGAKYYHSGKRLGDPKQSINKSSISVVKPIA